MTTNTGSSIDIKIEDVRQHTYHAFTPKPFMKNSFYDMDEELSSLLIEAHEMVGVLEGADLFMPDREILQNIFRYKEAYFSHLIDHPDSVQPF